jgi:hypothetical protein
MPHTNERAVLEKTSRPVLRTAPSTGRMQCLVVCPEHGRRQELVEAARNAGWLTYESDDVAAAVDIQLRMMLHLAIVDFSGASPATATQLRQLVAGLSRQRERLLMVCGGDGCPEEEIWARQLGTWIYCPGAVAVFEIAPLFQEARDLAERMNATRGSPAEGAAWTH